MEGSTRRKPKGKEGNGVYPEVLGRLLDTTLADLGIENKVAECKAFLAWESVVDPALTKHARPLRIVRGRLELAVPSPVWRTQLAFLKEDMKKRINSNVGCNIVREVVLINHPLPDNPSKEQK